MHTFLVMEVTLSELLVKEGHTKLACILFQLRRGPLHLLVVKEGALVCMHELDQLAWRG